MSVTPPEHLSPSSWNDWDTCPRQWAAKRIGGIKERPSAAMEIGSFDHRVAEELYKPCYPSVDRTLSAARRLAAAVWATEPTPESITAGEIDERAFKRQVWNDILGLFDLDDPPTVDVVAVELECNWTEMGVPFKVIIDRLERFNTLIPGIMTVDLKSGKKPKPKFKGPHHRQVVVGAMGAAASGHAPADSGALLYISTDPPCAERVDTSLRARTEVAKNATVVWEAMGAACATADRWEDFEPTAGPLCGFCHVADRCPEGTARVRRDMSSGWLTADRGLGARLVMEAGNG